MFHIVEEFHIAERSKSRHFDASEAGIAVQVGIFVGDSPLVGFESA